MITAEHRKPFLAFVLVCAAAGLIIANGLRTQVVDVLVGAGAPPPLIAAIAPDMVLGHMLHDAPPPPQRTPGGKRGAVAEAPVDATVLAQVAPGTSTTTSPPTRSTAAAGTSVPFLPATGKVRSAAVATPATAKPVPPAVVTPGPTTRPTITSPSPSRPGFLASNPGFLPSGPGTGGPQDGDFHGHHGPWTDKIVPGATRWHGNGHQASHHPVKSDVGKRHSAKNRTVKSAPIKGWQRSPARSGPKGPRRHESGGAPARHHAPPVQRAQAPERPSSAREVVAHADNRGGWKRPDATRSVARGDEGGRAGRKARAGRGKRDDRAKSAGRGRSEGHGRSGHHGHSGRRG